MTGKRLMAAGILLALAPSWLGLAGGWHWLLDLMAHFRWQYLVVSTLALLVAALRRQHMLAVAAALTLALNAALIGRLAWNSDGNPGTPPASELRVLSINLQTSNPHTGRVIAHVLASDADVVFLMEVSQQWWDALQPLRARYPSQFALPRPDNFGVAILGRNPLGNVHVLSIGDTPSIQAELLLGGHPFTLIGTHPFPPVGRGAAASRDAQLALLARHVAGLNSPALVVGDLNATPWSSGMRALMSQGLAFRSTEAPWTPTWLARSPLAIPIDHALASAPLVITSRATGPDIGSDHRPLAITVGFGEQLRAVGTAVP
jgi:endonuclease/exonuclease/phosphatase (EEP) superfamily protein YafD